MPTMTSPRSADTSEVVTGNFFGKYASSNFIHRFFVSGFLRSAHRLMQNAHAETILDVGCADGTLGHLLLPHLNKRSYTGVDIGKEEIARAKISYLDRRFEVADITHLPFADASFDLVIACEVFEHLADPLTALKEVHRVCKRYLLISVPWEPVWRALNIARGSYVREWGNTPGHLQHFSRRDVRRLLSPYFSILKKSHPLPWTMILAEKRVP